MNICLVSQNYPPETAQGGIGTQARNKACELVRLGHSVHVLSSAKSGATRLTTRGDVGVVVHRMPPLGQEPGVDLGIYHPHTYWEGHSWSVFSAMRQLSMLS